VAVGMIIFDPLWKKATGCQNQMAGRPLKRVLLLLFLYLLFNRLKLFFDLLLSICPALFDLIDLLFYLFLLLFFFFVDFVGFLYTCYLCFCSDIFQLCFYILLFFLVH
jgi:hypothetical protein